MPKRQCLFCNQLAIEGGSRCSFHARPSNWQRGKRSKTADYYSSTAWQTRRKRQLAAEPLCAVCGARASQADHIINMAAGGSPDGPLQSLCADCHRRKTGQEGHAARYGKRPP